MAINTLQEKFIHGLGSIYDAEQRFLEGQQAMLQNASDAALQQMLTTHIEQTQGHIRNLEQAFSLLGQQPNAQQNKVAAALVNDASQLMTETQSAPAVRDGAIGGAADKVEHFEIASYNGLIGEAQLLGEMQVLNLLRQNLQQEQLTAQLIEQSMPTLLQKAATAVPAL